MTLIWTGTETKASARRYLLLVGAVIAGLSILAGQSAAVPEIPTTLGYLVCVEDAAGVVGIVQVPFHRADPSKLDEFKASLKSAVTLIGRTTGREDVIRGAADITLRDVRRKGDSPTVGSCRTICSCATMICSSGLASCAPEDIIGCGGACGSCEKCIVSCPAATGNRK